jgi:hypothetical protein
MRTILLTDLDPPAKPTCIGTFYCYSESLYKTKNGFASSWKLNLLKRISCPGCSGCLDIDDIIDGTPISVNPKVKSGDIVRVIVHPGHPHWEYGTIEDWVYEIVTSSFHTKERK